MSKFVIYTPDHKDYFTGFVDAGKGNGEQGTGWNFSIESARQFRTFEQAEKAAKLLANTMSRHPNPYVIQICEVKEKRGQRKIVVLCDIQPAADRSDWYKDNLFNVTKDTEPPAEPDIAPVTFVLYRAETDDYLHEIEDLGAVERTRWHPHPEHAIRYATQEEAQAKAQELVSSKGYTLELCKLHETKKQMWTEPLGQCRPSGPNGDVSLN